MKHVLILDSNQRSALATTRSLGLHGVPIITGDETASSLAGVSKYSDQYIQYPSPASDTRNFITYLSRLVKKLNISIIIPMTELTTTLLLENQDIFPNITLPFSDIDTINSLSDKCSLMKLAKSLDIPIPPTIFVENSLNLPCELNNLQYPIVLKPSKSWLIDNEKWIHTAVKFANTSLEAEKILNEDPAFINHPFMIQERVPGDGAGVFSLYNKGQPLSFFSHHRVREKPPWGGVSVLSESTPVDPTLKRYAKSILDHADWHGIAMVEFKVDKNGKAYLMEVNTRFWGSLQLSIDSGVDFPWMLYQISCGQQVATSHKYKHGVRLRWILGDLDSLYILLKSNKTSIREKIKGVIRFLYINPFKTRHEVNRLDDLGPFKWEIKQYFTNIINK